MFAAHRSSMIFCCSGVSLAQNASLIIGTYCPTYWWSAYEWCTPASHSFALNTLSSVDTKASNVPCDNASGTFGQAVVFAIPPNKLIRQLIPTPPGLLI